MKKVRVFGDNYYFKLSFDINDFIGDGIWWLQVFDNYHELLIDTPIKSSQNTPNLDEINCIAQGLIEDKYYGCTCFNN